jgi:esterase/lipase superfamily enzyme
MAKRPWLAMLALVMLLGACAPVPVSVQTVPAPAPVSAPPPPPPPPPPPTSARPPDVEAPAGSAVVRVFFATDRNLTARTEPGGRFGDDRGTLRYGTCDVSIPAGHRPGELEAPSIWRLEFRPDPARHVVLLSASVAPEDRFFAEMAERLGRSGARKAFLFVHGYNVSFEDAARRTAQIAYDLDFAGVPVFYSWPSRGQTAAYTIDEQNIEWAQSNLRAFLADFLSRSSAQEIYLIAHSMGNRALTRAVASLLTARPELAGRLKEVILAAPDIDAEVFRRDIAPALVAAGRPVTLYASSKDLALEASRKVHGYARAGDSGGDLVVVPGVDTIDATRVDTGLLGHSYFAQTQSILSDIDGLVRGERRPEQRQHLRPVDGPVGRYWEYQP